MHQSTLPASPLWMIKIVAYKEPFWTNYPDTIRSLARSLPCFSALFTPHLKCAWTEQATAYQAQRYWKRSLAPPNPLATFIQCLHGIDVGGIRQLDWERQSFLSTTRYNCRRIASDTDKPIARSMSVSRAIVSLSIRAPATVLVFLWIPSRN